MLTMSIYCFKCLRHPHSDEELNTCPHVLTDAHLPQLLNLLKPVAPRWKDFGIQLQIPAHELDIIERAPGLAAEGVTGYMRECLRVAVRKHKKTKSDILKALRSPYLSENLVAKTVEAGFTPGR